MTQFLITLTRSFSKASTKLLDAIFPPVCTICLKPNGQHDLLCADCFQKLEIFSGILCQKCGISLKNGDTNTQLCGFCLTNDVLYTASRSFCAYNEASAKLIAGFKYKDKTHYKRFLAKMMFNACSDLILQHKVDIICPVPLHYLRMWLRMFNQSAALAGEIHCRIKDSGTSNVQYIPNLLFRTRYTRPQASLSRADRIKNLDGVFEVKEKFSHALAGKTILLIDDVITTGTTVEKCVKTLQSYGAKNVLICTFTKTAG